ncbi:MAG: hypothetical protein MUF42_10910 [Cytophagaceae bacterium]|jgi:hypothetical protein|nr:hypothetical protein [Cytophagaceae bacterium]
MEHQVSINLATLYGKKWLWFVFPAMLEEASAIEAVQHWKEHFNQSLKPGDKANLIFDCSHMKNYDTASRQLWQRTMVEHRANIGDIWIISQNRLILTAAKTMGLLTGFKIKVALSEEAMFDLIERNKVAA